MFRFILALFALLALVIGSVAQDIQTGKIKKVDADKKTIIITVDGKDRTFRVTDGTRLFGPNNRELKNGLKSKALEEGIRVIFKVAGDGQNLSGLRVGSRDLQPPEGIRQAVIKKIHAEKEIITLTEKDMDLDFAVTAATKFLDFPGKTPKEILQGKILGEGSPVMYKAERQKGKNVLLGLKLAGKKVQEP